jgi:hypothetical protein
MKLWHPNSGFKYNLKRLPFAIRSRAKRLGIIPDTRVPFVAVWTNTPNKALSFTLLSVWITFSLIFFFIDEPMFFSRMGSILVAISILGFAQTIIGAQQQLNLAEENFTYRMYFDDFSRANKGKFDLPTSLTPPTTDDGYRMAEKYSVLKWLSWWSGVLAILGTLQWGFGDLFVCYFQNLECKTCA